MKIPVVEIDIALRKIKLFKLKSIVFLNFFWYRDFRNDPKAAMEPYAKISKMTILIVLKFLKGKEDELSLGGTYIALTGSKDVTK